MRAKLLHPATFLKLFLSFFGLENLKGKSWSRRKAKISKRRISALFDHFCSNICECFRCWLTQNKWWTCIFSSFSNIFFFGLECLFFNNSSLLQLFDLLWVFVVIFNRSNLFSLQLMWRSHTFLYRLTQLF